MTDALARLKTALADRYAIQRELGSGGMATVYLAHDIRHNRSVALKVLKPELAAAVSADRFLREIEVMAKQHHPHILQLYDSGQADGFLYYVMPLVEGESLRDRLDRQRQLNVDEAVSIAGDIASALEYAHARGVIHRDIKPENILLQSGHALVADFGIALAVKRTGGARLTETGLSLGTPYYMSPEQASGDRELDARSDVYALGAVTYEMLVGDPPFTGSNAQAVLAKVMTELPTPIRTVRDAVSPGMDAAVSRALAKTPADRFDSAEEFVQALRSAWHSPPVSRRRWVSYLALVTFAVVIVAATLTRLIPMIRGGSVPEMAPPRPSIAVLPFRDMSPAGDQAWLGEGTAEAINSALSRLPLRVVARTSAFSLRDHPIAVVGDSLSVETVLEGSVRRDGEQIRIEARLVDADDESSLWSQSFEAQMTSVFDIQDSIARAVVAALQVELGTFRNTTMTPATTADPAAHEQYLRGRYRWNQRSEEGILAAIDHFRRAVALDSTYAAAWAGLADAFLVLPEYSAAASPETVARESEAALSRALRLDPELPDALTSAGWTHLIHRYDWEGAEESFNRALAIDSTSVGAMHWLSHLLSWQGKHTEAVRWAERAVEVDPLSVILRSNLAYILMDARQFDTALETAATVVRIDSGFGTARQTMWETYARAGRWQEAATIWLEWSEAIGLDPEASVAVAEGLAARADGAAVTRFEPELIDRLELGSQHRGIVLAALADYEGTLEALERGLLERSGSRSVLSMKINPLYDPLREQARFIALMNRAGLGL